MPRLVDRDWKKVSNDIIKQVHECNGTGRIRRFPDTIVVEIKTTRKEFENCIYLKLDNLQGVWISYVPEKRMTEGREYTYFLVFTKNPEDANEFDLKRLEDEN